MTDIVNQALPKSYSNIADATNAAGFTMASDLLACSLLRTLAASKPSGKFLELGTGSGLSTSWLLDGMDKESSLISIDNDAFLLSIALDNLGSDTRLQIIESDAGTWIIDNNTLRFDFIFADTWHGKYLLLGETLSMLNKGGLYVVDDMLPQNNWPEGHAEKAIKFVVHLESRQDILLTKQAWATGMIIAVKK